MAGKQKTMVLTVEELEAIRDEAADNGRRRALAACAQKFDAEEMLAIREQYEARLEEQKQKQEDLEFRLRLALARVRDIESATDKLRAIQESLKGVLGEVADEEKPALPPRRVSPPAVPARALRKDFKRAIA
jgi:chromosome segregation ATPase